MKEDLFEKNLGIIILFIIVILIFMASTDKEINELNNRIATLERQVEYLSK